MKHKLDKYIVAKREILSLIEDTLDEYFQHPLLYWVDVRQDIDKILKEKRISYEDTITAQDKEE